ncbi:piggyBac transposable element-derived protein 4-like [Sardina pilchardus]|uniref:piggyBac transposable element-derived protein 4-like n=1 Tax=Sardina pilchardus TaxID=27697 RepID=UPI002E0D9617
MANRGLTEAEVMNMIFSDDVPDLDMSSESESDSDEELIPQFVEEIEVPIPMDEVPPTDELRWEGAGAYAPDEFTFDGSRSGVQSHLPRTVSEADCFKLLMTEELVGRITEQTNTFAEQLKETADVQGKLQKWVNTTVPELYTFFVAILLMATVKKRALKDYWGTNIMYSTPFFFTLFSQDRFLILLRSLHFADNTTLNTADLLSKIIPVFSYLTTQFKKVFTPFQNLCIDESLMLWKGRLRFRQYIPSKRHRFGIKFFILCDVKTSYVQDLIIYTGSPTDIVNIDGLGVSGSVVISMLGDYLGKGHVLYVDNWYSSPTLFLYLMKRRTGACGTVRANRKGMPTFPSKMRKSDVEFKRAGQLLAVKWHDKRDVHVLSTVSKAVMADSDKVDYMTGQRKSKPSCVLDYNKHMGAVDRFDMRNSFVECTRKSLKWYKKVFFHLIDCCVHNAQIVYQQALGKVIRPQAFRDNLMRQLLEQYHTPRHASTAGRPSMDHPLRLTARHFPSDVLQTDAQGKSTRRHCKVCLHGTRRPRQRKLTRVFCAPCNTALCATPCFAEFHSLKHY